MTTTEKFNAIKTRMGEHGEGFTPRHLSVIILNGYIQVLKEKGLVKDGQYGVTQKGQNLIAILEEFDWQPTDADIADFVQVMAMPECFDAFYSLLRSYRDDREALLKEIDNYSDEDSN